MRNHATAVGVAALTILLLATQLYRLGEQQSGHPAPSPSVASESAPEPVIPVAQAAPSPSSGPAGLSVPSLAAYREEVHANPHQVPPLMIEFSRQVAERMKEAKSSQSAAESLFAQLAECATRTNEAVAAPLGAYCAVNAGELAALYPAALQERYAKVKDSLPQDVKRIAESMQ